MFLTKLLFAKKILLKLAKYAVSKLDTDQLKNIALDILRKEVNNPKNKISPSLVALVNAYFDGVNPKKELLELEKEVLTEE